MKILTEELFRSLKVGDTLIVPTDDSAIIDINENKIPYEFIVTEKKEDKVNLQYFGQSITICCLWNNKEKRLTTTSGGDLLRWQIDDNLSPEICVSYLGEVRKKETLA